MIRLLIKTIHVLVCQIAIFSVFSVFVYGQIIPVITSGHALVFKVNEQKRLGIVYMGKPLLKDAEYASIPAAYKQVRDISQSYDAAYTPAGALNLLEPAIQVTHADGNNSLDLKYESHTVERVSEGVFLFNIRLRDSVYHFKVELFIKAYHSEDVLEMWTEISHQEKKGVTLHKYASANLYIRASGFWLRQYHGKAMAEMQPEEMRLTHGIKMLDTKLGTRANMFQPSVFMVSLDQPATEDQGSVLAAGLEWSGNFRTDLEIDPQNNLRIISGINNYASAYQLKPGKVFRTPAFWYTFSSQGKGKASRNIHDWARKYKLPQGTGNRLTMLNNWEATQFDFNEQRLKSLFKDTKKLGVDLFLLDEGWFGSTYPRDDDHSALGDWEVNPKKLPNGISMLVSEAAINGVKFGIWIEPEMVSPKSELYKNHPEWAIRQPRRGDYYYRNQLVLDLSNPDGQDFILGTVDGLLKKNPGLAYLKWDCNAMIYNAHSSYLQHQSHLYVEYVQGLYTVLARLRAKYPSLLMMLCSGGGGRVDYAALKYFAEFWPSDNTDPLERIFIQWEYSYFYPAITSANHVTGWGKQSIKFRTDVAMMGRLGFDIALEHLNEKELLFCQQAVKTYDTIKHTIWHGDQYRLSDPGAGSVASVLYVAKDTSVAYQFNYLVNSRYEEGSKLPIRIKGLHENKSYFIEEINLYP